MRSRSDGLPLDRWLRVHVRAGGQIVGIASCSATVQAPVLVSITQDIGVYVEPNVWVRHAL